jgi:hypothetical protein
MSEKRKRDQDREPRSIVKMTLTRNNQYAENDCEREKDTPRLGIYRDAK